MKLLESQGHSLQLPSALVLNYAALDLNFTSWMNPDHLRLLQSEGSSAYLPGLVERDHYNHISPLSMVGDRKPLRRHRSWKDALRTLSSPAEATEPLRSRRSISSIGSNRTNGRISRTRAQTIAGGENSANEDSGTDYESMKEEDRPIHARVKFEDQSLEIQQERTSQSAPESKVGTRLTMTSRTGYFQDRIISPSMVCVDAILDLATFY